MSFSVMRQHPNPCSRVERTQLLYNFNLCVCVCLVLLWFPHGAQHPEGIPGVTNPVDDVASCSSVVSRWMLRSCEDLLPLKLSVNIASNLHNSVMVLLFYDVGANDNRSH